jgi:hypothetical protein
MYPFAVARLYGGGDLDDATSKPPPLKRRAINDGSQNTGAYTRGLNTADLYNLTLRSPTHKIKSGLGFLDRTTYVGNDSK